jgi:hypothetical protein
MAIPPWICQPQLPALYWPLSDEKVKDVIAKVHLLQVSDRHKENDSLVDTFSV